MIIRIFLFASVVFIAGCAQKNTTTNRAFGCWFVVSDGAGHQGYQAVDFTSSSATPQALPIFKNIDELRVALLKQSVTSIDTIGGYTNEGWKIRGLTPGELKALR